MGQEKTLSRNFSEHIERPIRLLEIWNYGGWTIKIYSIVQKGLQLGDKYLQIAKGLASGVISSMDLKEDHHFTGFLTIHIATMFNQVIFDYWARENELRHHVFKAGPDHPLNFKNITATGQAFCIWELKVIAFERDAWMEHVILQREAPSVKSYIESSLNIDE